MVASAVLHTYLPHMYVPHGAPSVAPVMVPHPPHAFGVSPVQLIDLLSAAHVHLPQVPHGASLAAPAGKVPPHAPQGFFVTQSTHALEPAASHSGFAGSVHSALLVHPVVHAPAEHANVHAEPLTQLPAASQVCGVLPLHWVVPGTQTPLHTPSPEHTLQVVDVTHAPLAEQVWESRALHRLLPGVHSPEHAPELQMYGHNVLSVQVDEALHSCRLRPLHCLLPGRQTVHLPDAVSHTGSDIEIAVHSASVLQPVHSPAVQVNSHGAGALIHLPAASHVCAVLPEHCFDPGLHSPAHTPSLQKNGHTVPST